MESVKVFVRMRPHSANGRDRCCLRARGSELYCGMEAQPYAFDDVFSGSATQNDIFEECGQPLIESCLAGYNCSAFTYGQTGSGKTYTMWGLIPRLGEHISSNTGLIPRVFDALFSRITEEEEMGSKIKVECSMVELYNERITDLLNPMSGNLALREGRNGIHIESVQTRRIRHLGDLLQIVGEGHANQTIAETNMNSESSRSHCLLMCTVSKSVKDENGEKTTVSRLNLIDLAGSERQKAAGTKGLRLKEACGINKSLSTLGHVIMSLAEQDQGKERHVPYRDSKLTHLLQDSLGGNSKTVMIANVSQSLRNMEETLSTLRFARGAKKIKNKATVNEALPCDVETLQNEVLKLRDQLSEARTHQCENPRSPLSFSTSLAANSGVCDAGEILTLRSELDQWRALARKTEVKNCKLMEEIIQSGAFLAARNCEYARLQDLREQDKSKYEAQISQLMQRVEKLVENVYAKETAEGNANRVEEAQQSVPGEQENVETQELEDEQTKITAFDRYKVACASVICAIMLAATCDIGGGFGVANI